MRPSRDLGRAVRSRFVVLLFSLVLLAAGAVFSQETDPPPATPSPTPGQSASEDAAGADDPFPPPVHETTLEATFDPDTRRVDGRQRLRWRNTASVPVEELQFHLYLNAFSSSESTFMRGSGGEMRGSEHGGEGWGFIEVDAMRLPDGTDLAAVEEFLRPDDGNPDDRTVARYPLPRPLAPGEWVELDIEFTSQLPEPPFARTGTFQDYVLAGQWFPKIAVFEDAGDRGREEPGWNAHQFHPASEFYADFGTYDATLTLPARYAGKVGATGRLVESRRGEDPELGDTVTVRFRQEGVHDFAWTADPDFLVLEDRFDPATDVPADFRRRWAETLGVDEAELELTPVELTLFLQPAHADQVERYMESAKAAIRGYGVRLGAYPYDTLTLVDPPWGALGSGGMEYPTFITLGTHPLLQVPGFRGVLAPEIVTVHEFGHQYFQGMIANNEFEESWIDEGINTYYENEVMDDDYGDSGVSLFGMETSYAEGLRGGLDGGEFRDPMVTPSWGYLTRGSYGLNSYNRPGVVLNHLEGLLGEAAFHRAMREFFQRHRFSHPSTADFEATIQEATGRNLEWFFSQALHSTRNLDYSVRTLTNRKIRDPKGIFWRAGERYEVGGEGSDTEEGDTEEGDTEEDDAEEGEADEADTADDEAGEGEAGDGEAGEGDTGDEEAGEADEADDAGDPRWRSQVVVFRHGEFIHPVTLEVTFDDGRVVRREWDGENRWARWTFTGPSKVVSAEIDPDHLWTLDHNRLNNSITTETDPAPALAFTTDLLYWFQLLMAATGLVG